jgi:hypothetical protein
LKTYAYSVQVLAKDAKAMSHHLRKIYADEPLFIPYSTKKTHPDLVAQAIVKQNQKISDTYVIVVVGVTREMMKALEPTLQGIKGILEYSETNKTDTSGRWNVLVDDREFKSVRKRLSTNLKQWIKTLPSSIRDTIPSHFPIAQVHQRYHSDEEDSSAGHASYMSSCAQSYGEFDETDADTANYLTPANAPSPTSYAAAVNSAPASSSTPMVREVIIQDPETRKLIEGLQAEIASLKLQRGNQTPSTVTTATSTPDSRTIARIEQVESHMHDLKNWMSEMVNLMREKPDQTSSLTSASAQGTKHSNDPVSPPSHQSKRANTSHTPDRPMYPHHLGYSNPGNTGYSGGNDGNFHPNQYGPYFPPGLPPGYHNGYPLSIGPPPPSPHYSQQSYPPSPLGTQPMSLTQEPHSFTQSRQPDSARPDHSSLQSRPAEDATPNH